MKKFNYFQFMAIASVLAITGCGSEAMLDEPAGNIDNQIRESESLTITASIKSDMATRMGSAEGESGIKLSWTANDKLYLLTSPDGNTWNDQFLTFTASKIDENNNSNATFTCADFSLPEGTKKVKYVFSAGQVNSKADLEKNAQKLGLQTGSIADVAGLLHMESAVMDAATSDDVKKLTVSMVHSNAVMKVSVKKGDVKWGDNYNPQSVALTLDSNTMTLFGTENNTVTITNPEWNTDGEIVANVVVCMEGAIADGDRWILSTTDGKGNSLIQATNGAKALIGGKRYNAPITFSTADYFPILERYMTLNLWNQCLLEEATKTLTVAKDGGNGGWSAENGIFPTTWDLTGYSYLVVDLAGNPTDTGNITLRSNGFNADGYALDFNSETSKIVVELGADLTYEVNGETQTLDKTKVNVISFWSWPGVTLKFNKIYLTDEKPADTPVTPGVDDPQIGVGDIIDSGENAW